MAAKMISRIVFVSIFILCWLSAATAESKCFITFDSSGKKTEFAAILYNPTTEILDRNYFPNFTDMLPFTFDEKGKLYPYKEGKRKWIGALIPVEIGRNLLESFGVGPGDRIIGLVPNNRYYFFSMAKIASEKDYVISNIFCFNLDSDYHLGDTKLILWSDLPETVQNSIKDYLKNYLPKMEVNASVNYVIDELDIDKRNRKMPVYKSFVYRAADLAYKLKEEELKRLAYPSTLVYKSSNSIDVKRAYYKNLEKMLKEAGEWDKYKDFIEKECSEFERQK